MPFSTVATEPFDEALDRRIVGINSERHSAENKITERRKIIPGRISAMEADLQVRRAAAEWMEEGEDEESSAGETY